MAFTIPLSDVRLTPAQLAAGQRVLESGWLSMGPETLAFESAYAAACGAAGAVCVGSATAGLVLALHTLGVGPGDEVILPSLTFVADANAVRVLGASPVFADVTAIDRPTVDLGDVARAVTPRTKAVIVVHYAGYVADLAPLEPLREQGIATIADASHAVGPLNDSGRWIDPAVADLTVFSFFANKNLPVGEGGMVLALDADRLERVRSKRSHGMTTGTWDRHTGHASDYDVVEPGWNFRPTEVAAALGSAGLIELHSQNHERRRALTTYREAFAGSPVELIHRAEEATTGHLTVAVLPARQRPGVRQALMEAGIQSSFHYPPIHRFTAYQGARERPLPRTEAAADHLVTLPLHPWLSDDDVGRIATIVLGAVS